MKLEVGQFARLKSGYICKIININDFREPNMKYGVEANYLKDKLKLKKYIINKNGNIKGFYVDDNGIIYTHWLNNEEIIVLKEKGE